MKALVGFAAFMIGTMVGTEIDGLLRQAQPVHPRIAKVNHAPMACTFEPLPGGGIAFSGPVGCRIGTVTITLPEGNRYLLLHPHQQ